MFNFFHRKKKVVVDCFTHLPPVYQYAPIVRASKTFPEWWKNLPSVGPLKMVNGKFDIHNNMKKCYGFIELYKRGAVLENWADTHVRVSPETYDYYTTIGETPNVHSPEEYKGGFQNYHHMKLMSPWHFKEKTGLHFLFMGTEWNNELPYKVLPGVVEYKNVTGTHVNVMLPKYKDVYEFDFKLGQPLAHIIPLNDDVDVEFKCHLVTLLELNTKILRGSISFEGMRRLVQLDNRNEERKSKCPFH
jgi:hypothetical protein